MLNISPALLIITALVFLFLLITLNKILYRPLLEFMQKRDDSIASDYENAGKNSSDVEAYHKEAEQIIREAKAEAGAIRAQAIEAARENMIKKIEQRKAELEEEYTAFLEGLETERTEFKNSLLSHMPQYKESIKAKLNQI
jgi:F-type H+-transporting ATPase subunit b